MRPSFGNLIKGLTNGSKSFPHWPSSAAADIFVKILILTGAGNKLARGRILHPRRLETRFKEMTRLFSKNKSQF
jgi:uncharacterized protein YfiM (DUF2279 family)